MLFADQYVLTSLSYSIAASATICASVSAVV
jgi:hypothetical protein